MKDELTDWLLDSDPAIRWQVMRDLLDESEDTVGMERAKVAVEGWGARLLGLQGLDGNWGGGAWVYQSWMSTMETLRTAGRPAADPRVMNAMETVTTAHRQLRRRIPRA